MAFVMIVWICTANDIATIRFQGLWVYRDVTCCAAFWNILTCFLRMMVTHFIFFTVCVFILTTETNDPEDYITLSMKFSALLIIIRLDEMVIGAFFNALGKSPAFDDINEPDQVEDILIVGENVLKEHKRCDSKLIIKCI